MGQPHGLLRLTLRGAAAGLVAAAVANGVESVWTRVRLAPKSAPIPPTSPAERLARRIGQSADQSLAKREAAIGGAAIHYAIGAGLGIFYALGARYWRAVRSGSGAGYGLGVWLALEEVGLAALALKPPPWRLSRNEHLMGLIVHLAFGASLDAVLGPPYVRDRRS